MRSNKRVVKSAIAGAIVLAMGVTTLFAGANTSYAAGEAKLNKTSRNILTRKSYDFDVTGAPSDAVITWKSSDEAVATVDKDGVVTGVTKGTATITCEVTSAGKTQKLTAKVSIRKPAVKIEIKNKITELEYAKTYDLNRTLTPKTSNDVTTWKSSDTKIATVDANGVVKALKDGTVTITATTMSGRTDSVEITVFGAPKPTATPAPTKAPDATATPVPTKAPTKAPAKPTQAPQSSATKYDITKLETAASGHWGVTISGNKVSYDGQYAEAKFMLPSAVTVGDYKSLTVALGSASDAVAVKLYDTNDTMIAVWYNQTATMEYTLTESMGVDGSGATIDQKAKIAAIGIMSNNGACEATITGIELTAKPGAAKPTPTPKPQGASYDITKLETAASGHWGVTLSGNKIVYDGQYAEAKYMLPSAITVGDYKNLTVSLGSASDAVAIKLYDTNDTMIAVWYNQTATMEYALTESMGVDGSGATIDQKAKIGAIGIMSNNGACEATITGISFK